ncbi:hypothetical protein HGRIS_003002 [Hohenbuehelia grisea]|uniref:HMG box domain-containing protein n=1 Tax=Hohenbuehelia grisea TaxID=104357 RepID=A0ABR3JME3_9AGAR
MDPEVILAVIYDAVTTSMSSDPPQHRPYVMKEKPKVQTPLSPAQAIADAWNKETPENQERWRQANDLLRKQFSTPRRARDSKM